MSCSQGVCDLAPERRRACEEDQMGSAVGRQRARRRQVDAAAGRCGVAVQPPAFPPSSPEAAYGAPASPRPSLYSSCPEFLVAALAMKAAEVGRCRGLTSSHGSSHPLWKWTGGRGDEWTDRQGSGWWKNRSLTIPASPVPIGPNHGFITGSNLQVEIL